MDGIKVPMVGFSFSLTMDDNDAHNRNTCVVQTHVPSDESFDPVLEKIFASVAKLKAKARVAQLKNELAVLELQLPQVEADFSRVKDRLRLDHEAKFPDRPYRPSAKDRQESEKAQVTVTQWHNRRKQLQNTIAAYEAELTKDEPDSGADCSQSG